MSSRAKAFLSVDENGNCACDLQLVSPDATAEDLLQALADFAAENMADCRGCPGCCQERAPLIAADIPALATLLPDAGRWPAHAVCRAFARVSVEGNGAADIILRRRENNSCCFLDEAEGICREWPARPFVCRSHFCLPRSPRLQELRSRLINQGEDELLRLLMAEEAAGAPPLLERPLAELLDAADYPPTGQSGCLRYAEILLRSCVDDVLWAELLR